MAQLVFDVIEQIFVRLDVIDLIRCKSVCKSWLFLISTPLFVKSHLNYTYNSCELRRKRIVMHHSCDYSIDLSFFQNQHHIVGSSNGLLCISPKDGELLVTNPLTREVRNLPMVPELIPRKVKPRQSLGCWGFGYDSSSDDYKVIVGFGKGKYQTRFHVFTLKANIWKLIGDINYKVIISKRPGILCEGSLHWFMDDRKKKKVIISFDLSRDEFKKIPQPYDLLYDCQKDDCNLGVIEESLCIYKHEPPRSVLVKNSVKEIKRNSTKWIMRSYSVRESWQGVPYLCEKMFDADPHYLKNLEYITHKSSSYCRSYRAMDYFANPIFVQSLVSPHVNKMNDLIKTKKDVKRRRSGHAKNSNRNTKLIKNDHLAPSVSS